MKKVELNRNEQLYGPSPSCLETIRNFNPDHVNRYADGYSASILRTRLSSEFNFSENQIILGNGAEDILRVVFNQLKDNETILISNPSYTYYQKYLDSRGITVNTFSFEITEKEYVFNTANILNSYNQYKPKVLLITSPNNPTGSNISSDQLKEVLEKISTDCILVLDEAYFGFDSEYNQDAVMSLLNKYPNLMIIRSFSKLYGLAGLRIGFGLCGSVAYDFLNWQHQYLGFSRLLEEVAIVALDSKEYYDDISSKIVSDRKFFIAEVSKSKHFKPYESKSNFVLVGFDAKYQTSIEKILKEDQSPIAKLAGEGLMRVTIGTTDQVKQFADRLKSINYEY